MKPGKNQYLLKRPSQGIISLCLIGGFLLGTTCGHFLFASSAEDVIKLTMVYSSEKSTWIAESQQLFLKYWEAKRAQNASIKPIVLDFQPYGSGDMLISLLNGEIKPIIWSPASNIWVPMLNSKWQDMTLSDHIIAPNYTRLIYSPIVMAIWANFYRDHPLHGIKDLHDLVNSTANIKMAHTDARESNSGFMTTAMFVSAYLNMDPALITMANISDPQLSQWMREIESSAVFYGKSTGFLGKYMRDQGPDALQIAFLYENLVQDYTNSALEKFGQRIVAIYPEEGTVYSDHPFCILNADWVDAEQYALAQEYLAFLNTKELLMKAIATGYRPIDNSLLNDAEVFQVYNQSFNPEHGVTSDPTQIRELLPPQDGNVIARIPDLWLLTRNTVE